MNRQKLETAAKKAILENAHNLATRQVLRQCEGK
jgi:hypothetical protein